MILTRALFWIIGLLLASAACSPLHDPMYRRIAPDAANPIRTVAVLPLVNQTNDVEAPAYVREEMILRLQALHYAVQPATETDQRLRDRMGITLGRQLDLATAPQLSDTLGVDALMYGVLEDFNTTIAGVLTEKKVRARFALIRTADGLPFWSGGAGVVGRIRVSGGVSGKVATGLEAKSRLEAAGESAEQAKKAAVPESSGRLPGGLDRVAAPWFTLPTVEIGGDKERQRGKEGGNVAAGLMLGLGERLVEKAVGKPLYQETRLMLNLLLRPDAVAAADTLALQRLEQLLAGRRPHINREQIAVEIATKSAELNTIRMLRPLPIGPGAAGLPGPAPVGEQALPER